MLTFAKFLTEKLFASGNDGFGSPDGYFEIWKNPTAEEFFTLARECDEIGAWVSDRNIYVWNRSHAQHHDAKNALYSDKKVSIDRNAIPLYLYPGTRSKTLKVKSSGFSAAGSTRYMPGERIVAYLSSLPAAKGMLKAFPKISPTAFSFNDD